MAHLPLTTFRRCVVRYDGEHRGKRFSCRDQNLCMAFPQMTFRETLSEIGACLRSQYAKLYHMGFRSTAARNTLANANAAPDWRIHADFAQSLITVSRNLYVNEPPGVDLADTVYDLDGTTIDPYLSAFAAAPFRSTKAVGRLHTLLGVRGNIPSFWHISDGKWHELNIVDHLIPEAGAFYVIDRDYIDFDQLYRLHHGNSYFVIRGESNLRFQRRYSRASDRGIEIICDQLGVLTGFSSVKDYPALLRRIRCKDERAKTLVFLTNNLELIAATISELYRGRWRVELFFKWLKQHLCMQAFFGTSENAVKSQIWIALSGYVLVAILKRRLNLTACSIRSYRSGASRCSRERRWISYLSEFHRTKINPSIPTS